MPPAPGERRCRGRGAERRLRAVSPRGSGCCGPSRGTPRCRCPRRLSPPLPFPCSGEIAETPASGDTHPAAASSFFSSSSSSPRRKSQIKGRGAAGCAARRGGRRRRRPPDAAAIRHCRARLGAGRREARGSGEGPGGRGAAAPPARPLPRAAAAALPDARPPPAGSPGWTGGPLLPALALCAAKGKCGEREGCAPRGRGAAFVCSAAPRRRGLSPASATPALCSRCEGDGGGAAAPHTQKCRGVAALPSSVVPEVTRCTGSAAPGAPRCPSAPRADTCRRAHRGPPGSCRLPPELPRKAANKGGRGGESRVSLRRCRI